MHVYLFFSDRIVIKVTVSDYSQQEIWGHARVVHPTSNRDKLLA